MIDLSPAPFERRLPFRCFPLRCLPLAEPFKLPFDCSFGLAFASLALFAAFSLASFSACFFAFRSAFAFRRSRSARASARFFLRFFSQASHLQPIGFRSALK